MAITGLRPGDTTEQVARIGAAICGVQGKHESPGYRFAHPGYACYISHRLRAGAPQRSTSISTAARPITATVIQPRITIVRLAVNAPITDLREAINTITTNRGTAAIPLITALQNSAFIGLIGEYWINNPESTLAAITA